MLKAFFKKKKKKGWRSFQKSFGIQKLRKSWKGKRKSIEKALKKELEILFWKKLGGRNFEKKNAMESFELRNVFKKKNCLLFKKKKKKIKKKNALLLKRKIKCSEKIKNKK